jgi:hypothetical protein
MARGGIDARINLLYSSEVSFGSFKLLHYADSSKMNICPRVSQIEMTTNNLGIPSFPAAIPDKLLVGMRNAGLIAMP